MAPSRRGWRRRLILRWLARFGAAAKLRDMHAPTQIVPVDQTRGPYFWGVDIGGTGIKCGLVSEAGHSVGFYRIDTIESAGPRSAIRRVAELIEQAESELNLVGAVPRICIGAPGPMDLPRGLLVAPPQLPSWWNFNICAALSQATGRPISFLNDANAAAYGEFWLGSAHSDRSMVMLTLGTGVGGGIIVDNELINGVNSFGSECGHILVDTSPDAAPCGWGGGHGQLEAYASATGVVLQTVRLLPDYPDSPLHRYDHVSPTAADDGEATSIEAPRLTSKAVYDAAVAGDSLALRIIDDTARWLGIGVTTLVHTIDPGSVVLGGAMNFGGDGCVIGQRFMTGIREEFRRRTFPNVFAGTSLSFASLGSDAGYLGAAGYAAHAHRQQTGQ